MKTIAIIAEYNPFHNGHLYLIDKAKEITNSDYCLALMSGNFMQRGEAAVCSKYTRAQMAVSSGIDLCLELPFVYASGSAYDFANGAVNILNSLNTVDYLCFGAERDDMDLFDTIAGIIINEPKSYSQNLKAFLKDGQSYPNARQNALFRLIENDESLKSDKDLINDLISKPNNILALEYIAALKRTGSAIKPVIIKREKAGYSDYKLYGSISSACAIRNEIKSISNETDIVSSLEKDMPEVPLSLLASALNKEFPVSSDSLIPFIQGIKPYICNATDICDLNQPLLNKLQKADLCTDYSGLVNYLKSKDITETRINRALLHLITGYKTEDRKLFYENGTAFYASILSFRENKTDLLKSINKNSRIPLITKKSDFEKYISEYENMHTDAAKRMWELDIRASELYRNIVFNTLGTKLPNEYTTKLPIV